MNSIKTIQSIIELREKKKKLERELSIINEQFQEEENSCNHVSVHLGMNPPTLNNDYRCLFCGKGKNEYFFDSKYVVHAENYLTNFDISDEKQVEEKFDNLQTMALGIMKENPNMDHLEFTNRFNCLIASSIEQREKNSENQQNKQLVKDNKRG